MKYLLRLLTVSVWAGLVACSDAPPAAEAEAAQPSASTARSTPQEITRENQGVLTDAQAAGINAANRVSTVLEDAEKQRQRQIEEATR